LTDRVSNILFCPTDRAVENLKKEGFDHYDCDIIKSGDVMYDGALFYRTLSQKPGIALDEEYILCTIHRAENTDDPKRPNGIFSALRKIAKEKQIVLPLYPRTKQIVHDLGIDTRGITIIDPVGYLEMVWLIEHSMLVMTDSGGLQKEAYFFSKPCITLRDETEWVELVEYGVNRLAGAQPERILSSYHDYRENVPAFDAVPDLYGEGDACRVIVDTIRKKAGR
jgi:UDP-GlcNAc3NAcA epimerase